MTLEELQKEYKSALLEREKKIKELGIVEGILQTLEYIMSKEGPQLVTKPSEVIDAEVVK